MKTFILFILLAFLGTICPTTAITGTDTGSDHTCETTPCIHNAPRAYPAGMANKVKSFEGAEALSKPQPYQQPSADGDPHHELDNEVEHGTRTLQPLSTDLDHLAAEQRLLTNHPNSTNNGLIQPRDLSPSFSLLPARSTSDPGDRDTNPLGRPANNAKYKPCTGTHKLCICALLLPGAKCADHDHDGSITLAGDMIERCDRDEYDTNPSCQYPGGGEGSGGEKQEPPRPGVGYAHNQAASSGGAEGKRVGIWALIGSAVLMLVH